MQERKETDVCLYMVHIMYVGERFGKSGGNLTICSWNVNGIKEPVKRGKVLAHLKSLQADIMFLQETHLKKDSHS